MKEVFLNIYDSLVKSYTFIVNNTSPLFSDTLNVIILALIISIISLFIWNFYNSISRRDIFRLDLYKYNLLEHSFAKKFLALILYLIEYILVMPFLIAVWSFGLAIFILLLTNEQTLNEIMVLTTALILSIRIMAYTKKEIAKDIAKLFPFISLSVFLLSLSTFKVELLFNQITTIPTLLYNIWPLIIAVLIIEIILRLYFTIKDFIKSEEGQKEWWIVKSDKEKPIKINK